jgi:hypothetical protein
MSDLTILLIQLATLAALVTALAVGVWLEHRSYTRRERERWSAWCAGLDEAYPIGPLKHDAPKPLAPFIP